MRQIIGKLEPSIIRQRHAGDDFTKQVGW